MSKKSYAVKPTKRQKLAFQNISENIGNPQSIGNSLVKAGYSVKTSESPQLVLESKGFKQLCEESGLSDNMILKALADDIQQKPRDRSKELAIACKVKGLYKADNEQRTMPIDIADADFIEIIRAYKVHR